MKCAFLGTKIAASTETAKRNLLKDVKGIEKLMFVCLENSKKDKVDPFTGIALSLFFCFSKYSDAVQRPLK